MYAEEKVMLENIRQETRKIMTTFYFGGAAVFFCHLSKNTFLNDVRLITKKKQKTNKQYASVKGNQHTHRYSHTRYISLMILRFL